MYKIINLSKFNFLSLNALVTSSIKYSFFIFLNTLKMFFESNSFGIPFEMSFIKLFNKSKLFEFIKCSMKEKKNAL